MISRNRSISTAAAMSIERTTSANSTVTCLYSAASTDATSCDPHVSQNRAPSCGAAPHDRHTAVASRHCIPRRSAAPTDCLIRQAYGVSHSPMGRSDDIDLRDTSVCSTAKGMLTVDPVDPVILSIPLPGFLIKKGAKGLMDPATDGLRKRVLNINGR